MSSSGGRAISISRLVIVVLILLGLYILRDNWLPTVRQGLPVTPNESPPQRPQSDHEEQINHHDAAQEPPETTYTSCRDVPGADNIMVLLKTGATEIYQKLPAHFVTTFKCVPHFMIFSDLEQEFADYPVYDAIAGIGEDFRMKHPDFELYRKLQQYKREGQDMSKLQGSGSWNLDKWKFLPMLHKAYEMAEENIDWFVIMEADTSLSWTNLLQWLRTMDSKEAWYLGAQNVIGDTTFAHGGSGIVISRKALALMEDARQYEGRESFDADFDRILSVSCCGDEVLARALLTAHVHLTPSWPLIQGETVASLDWTAKHWCAVAISWHHVTPVELDSLWQFESDWIEEYGWETPYLYRDVFEAFIQRHVTADRSKWDNLSKDKKLVAAELAAKNDLKFSELRDYEQNATTSKEACAEACKQMRERDCVQWMYSSGRCHLGKDVRFGRSDERAEEHWVSGWMQGRLKSFKDRHADCKTMWAG